MHHRPLSLPLSLPLGLTSTRLAFAAFALGLMGAASMSHAQTEILPGETPPPAARQAPPAPTRGTVIAPTASPTAAPTVTAPAAPALPTNSGIYRWKDANGKVHFGDRAPPNASRVDIRNDAPSAAETQAAQERVQAMQRHSDDLAAERRGQRASGEGSGQAAAKPDASPNESACQAKWREYETSYACFNPYRLANGGVKAEAYKHCKSMPRPAPCN